MRTVYLLQLDSSPLDEIRQLRIVLAGAQLSGATGYSCAFPFIKQLPALLGIPVFPVTGPDAPRSDFLKALEACVRGSDGNLVVIACKELIRSCIAFLSGAPAASEAVPSCYGSVSGLCYSGDGSIHVVTSRCPPPLDPPLCRRLLRAGGASQDVIDHCEAVSAAADTLAARLMDAGIALNRGEIHSAALLHDIARHQPHHAEAGAGWLRILGYEATANIVFQHHNLKNPSVIDEAAIVYFADKLVHGSSPVTIDERFQRSLRKCTSDEAKAAHQLRYAQALSVQCKIDRILKGSNETPVSLSNCPCRH